MSIKRVVARLKTTAKSADPKKVKKSAQTLLKTIQVSKQNLLKSRAKLVERLKDVAKEIKEYGVEVQKEYKELSREAEDLSDILDDNHDQVLSEMEIEKLMEAARDLYDTADTFDDIKVSANGNISLE